MSPEQLQGQQEHIDVRTDVYSLGALLYELLHGQRPLNLQGLALVEATRVVLEVDPVPLGTLDPALRGDLEVIVQKAMAKEKEARYGSASELADDLDRYLADRPVEARPPTWTYRLRKFSRRHRIAVCSGTIALVALIVGITGTALGFVRASRSAKLAAERAHDLELTTAFQQGQLSGLDASSMAIDLRHGILDKARSAWERDLAVADLDARASQLEELLAGCDFAGLVVDTLRQHIFDPAVAEIDRDFAEQPLLQASLLQALAVTTRELGLLSAAQELQERALTIRENRLPEGHKNVLESNVETGRLLHLQGDYAQARRHFEFVLKTDHEMDGEQALSRTGVTASLAATLSKQGEWERALGLHEQVVELCRQQTGPQHIDTLNAMSNVAVALGRLDRYTEARDLLQVVLEAQRSSLEEDDPATARTTSALGVALMELGEFDGARDLLEHSLNAFVRSYGEEHPRALSSMGKLGRLYLKSGDAKGAKALQERALAIQRRVLGSKHVDRLANLSNYASTLRSLGDFNTAHEHREFVLQSFLETLPEKHPSIYKAMSDLAVVLVDLRDPRKGPRVVGARTPGTEGGSRRGARGHAALDGEPGRSAPLHS